MTDRIIRPQETQRRFILSKATVSCLIGPQGEGKSWAAIAAMLFWSQKAQKKLRAAIVRDTFTNIERNTIPSIQKMLGDTAKFNKGGRKLEMENLDTDLFGVKDLASLSNLQGSEYDIAWLEEPAPVYETGNAGLREEVFDIFYSRGSRELESFHKLLVTMNPADEEHWTFRRLVGDDDPEIETIFIPYGENQYLPEEERERTKKAYKDRPDLYDRYVRGVFSFVPLGVAVTPEYNPAIHYLKYIVNPINTLTYRFWDGGLHPTCVILQITPMGKAICTDCLCGDNMGMKQFVQSIVKPTLAARYPMVQRYRDMGDMSLMQREQADSSVTAAGIIEEELGTFFEGGEQGWAPRLEAVKELLNRLVGGEPMFQVSKNATMMHRTLRGGWHFKTDPSGKVIRDKAVKDKHSHPGDALSHGLAKIFGYNQRKGMRRVGTRKIARSYATPTL